MSTSDNTAEIEEVKEDIKVLKEAEIGYQEKKDLARKEPVMPSDYHGRWRVPVVWNDGDLEISDPTWEEGNQTIQWNDNVAFTFATGDISMDEVENRFEASKGMAISQKEQGIRYLKAGFP